MILQLHTVDWLFFGYVPIYQKKMQPHIRVSGESFCERF